jgi:hypothetical protein
MTFFWILSGAGLVSAQESLPKPVPELVAPNGAGRLENYRTSWLGNSFGGLDGTGRKDRGKWVQQDIAAMCVTDDGTVYTNVPWEEAGGNCSMYKDGQMLGSARHTHGWGFNGGKAVAVNGKYVYIALSGHNEGGHLDDPNTWPPKGYKWYGISRRLRSDFTKGAGFDGGKGGKGDTLPQSFLVINEVPETEKSDDRAAVAGLWASDDRLYVSNPHTGNIEIYDAETMKKETQWKIPAEFAEDIRQIACDADGNLWVLLERPREALLADHFLVLTRNGKLFVKNKPHGKVTHCPVEIPENREENFPHNYLPSAFCFDQEGRLLVAATGIWQSVLFLEKNGWDYVWGGQEVVPARMILGLPMFTLKGGVFGDQIFRNITAIGTDAAGNVYVAGDWATNGGGTVLESYSFTEDPPAAELLAPVRKNFSFTEETGFFLFRWKLNWRLFGLEFIDCAAMDPEEETTVYTKEEVFKLDYAKPSGEEAAFLGSTAFRPSPLFNANGGNPEKFRDPRLNIKDSAGVWVRNLDGKKFLFVRDMSAKSLQVYREETQEEQTGMVPAVLFSQRHLDDQTGWLPGQPAQGEWIWRNVYTSPYKESERFLSQDKEAPVIEGWWVDSAGEVWQATLNQGIRRFRFQGTDRWGNPLWDYENLDIFPHPGELKQVKRIRYDAAADTLYLGGCAVIDGAEHKNQHWKPMGPVVCRYDHFLRGENPGKTAGKLRWKVLLPYVTGSQGHESCEPMGFDIAGDYMFVPYTGASKTANFTTGHVEVYRLDDAVPVGFMEPDPMTVGEIGLQDMRECLNAYRRSNGEYVIFLEDDYKAKVVMFRWPTHGRWIPVGSQPL